MLYWATNILAFGYLAFEIFLLATRRGGGAAKTADRGTLRLVWLLISGGCLAGFLLARRITILDWPEQLWIIYLADFLLVSGIVIRIWAIWHLGKYFTVDVGIQPGHHVIRDGPYRFARHPSYSRAILAVAGLACLTFNWLGFFLVVTCASLAYTLRISAEEEALLAQFGSEYSEYAAHTKRLIPGVY